MQRYIFFGVVVPERADLGLQNARRSLEDPASGATIGSIQVDIEHSQVLIHLDIAMVVDFGTVRNLAYSETKLFINAAALVLGGGYDLDIRKGFNLTMGVVETFKPRSTPIVKFIETHRKVDPMDVVRATYGPHGAFIAYALEDLADGLRTSGRNAMFFFYRVFDSLREHMKALHDGNEKAQWEKVREVTGIPRADIDFIKGFADPVRHGAGTSYTAAEIERAERLAWTAIHGVILDRKTRGVLLPSNKPNP